jgi:ribosomal-protein-alanine N-acetyltransferase
VALRWRDRILADGELVVRPWEDGDQERLGTSQRDPEIGRYFGRAVDLDEGAPLPDDPHAPVLAITDGGAVVGVIWFRRGARPYEVGYYLRQDCWGRGLATRSLVLVSDWMLGEPGVDEIVLCTHPENARSQAVAERAGYARDGVIEPYAEFKDGTTLALRFVRRASSRT